MNRCALFTGFLMLFISTSVWATDANSCASKSAGMKPSERDAFMKSCLAQVHSATNSKEGEQQRKRAVCEQNAMNHKLQGNEKANYVTSCLNTNAAEAAARSKVASAEAKAASAKAAPNKPARKVAATQSNKPAKPSNHVSSCAQQAKDKGLKGEDRNKFLRSCKQG